jgi:amino acid transporter
MPGGWQSFLFVARFCFRIDGVYRVSRIFAVLAVFSIFFVAGTLVLGLTLGDVHNPNDLATQRWATVHRLSGVAAALAVMFTNGVVVTYFVGTSRWCREVTDAYRLDPAALRESNAIKRRTFPLAVLNMLTIVGVVALGGAADPGASLRIQPPNPLTWANWHLIGALFGLAILAFASAAQWINIQANHEVIQRIMQEVRRVRQERGLET